MFLADAGNLTCWSLVLHGKGSGVGCRSSLPVKRQELLLSFGFGSARNQNLEFGSAHTVHRWPWPAFGDEPDCSESMFTSPGPTWQITPSKAVLLRKGQVSTKVCSRAHEQQNPKRFRKFLNFLCGKL